jgi:hypothetical protein
MLFLSIDIRQRLGAKVGKIIESAKKKKNLSKRGNGGKMVLDRV